jgi:hypothetical protein
LDHPKTGQIGPVLGWSILGYLVLVNMDHPKSRFVRISDPHCKLKKEGWKEKRKSNIKRDNTCLKQVS